MVNIESWLDKFIEEGIQDLCRIIGHTETHEVIGTFEIKYCSRCHKYLGWSI
jgi:hypothetical protein